MSTSARSASASGPDDVSPFRASSQPPRPGFWARLFRGKLEDAQRAITNRLTGASIATIGPAEISADLAAYGVRGGKARAVLHAIWRDAVTHFMSDERVSDGEARYLGELRRVLGLNERELRQLEEELVHSRFASAVQSAIADNHLSLSERSHLDQLAKSLRLAESVATRILNRAQEDRIQEAGKEATRDQRLSPTEIADLHALAASLGAELTIDAETQRTMDRMSLLWRIENDQAPVYSVPINLQRGETCHAVVDATWMELRTRTERINYGGPVASIRICKGVRYRVGSVRVQRITREELTEIDRGRLYLTNKRVIFDGTKKNTTIRLSGLLSFTPFSDGVVLEKASGKSPHLLIHNADVEIFHVTLGALLAQAE